MQMVYLLVQIMTKIECNDVNSSTGQEHLQKEKKNLSVKQSINQLINQAINQSIFTKSSQVLEYLIKKWQMVKEKYQTNFHPSLWYEKQVLPGGWPGGRGTQI